MRPSITARPLSSSRHACRVGVALRHPPARSPPDGLPGSPPPGCPAALPRRSDLRPCADLLAGRAEGRDAAGAPRPRRGRRPSSSSAGGRRLTCSKRASRASPGGQDTPRALLDLGLAYEGLSTSARTRATATMSWPAGSPPTATPAPRSPTPPRSTPISRSGPPSSRPRRSCSQRKDIDDVDRMTGLGARGARRGRGSAR